MKFEGVKSVRYEVWAQKRQAQVLWVSDREYCTDHLKTCSLVIGRNILCRVPSF